MNNFLKKVSIKELSIRKLIADILKIPLEDVVNDLSIGDIPEWDSMAHMQIFALLESDLGIKLNVDQIIEIEDVEDIIDACIN